jgi:hypothetical protein
MELVGCYGDFYSRNFAEFYEEALRILSYLTYYGNGISENLWQVFPLLINAFDHFGVDFISSKSFNLKSQLETNNLAPDLLIPLDNYISLGTEYFLSKPEYLDTIFKVCKLVLTSENVAELDASEGAKLIEVVLQHCRGRVDHYLLPFLEISLMRLPTAKKTFFKILLLEVVLPLSFHPHKYTIFHCQSIIIIICDDLIDNID